MAANDRPAGAGKGRGSDPGRKRGLPGRRGRHPDGSVGKRIAFDAQTWHALHQLSLDTVKSLQELADEAFRDLLRKYHRPTTVREMLRASVRSPANDKGTGRGKRE